MDAKESTPQSLSSGISGNVKSVDGILLSNAKVTCNEVKTTTLADGTFAIANLEPGTYDIHDFMNSLDSIKPFLF